MNRYIENISAKIGKIKTILETPGALKAKRAGLYIGMYQTVYRLKLAGIRPATFFDIGANRGMFSQCIHRVFPKARIHAFEPIAECYRELTQLKKSIDAMQCHNVALGSKSEETVIHRSEYDYSSSLLEMGSLHREAFPYSSGQTAERIRVDTLDNIFSNVELHRPLFMKVDVQGYEKHVFEGSKEVLKKTDYILCELSLRPLYDNQPLFHEVYLHLVAAGFSYCGQYGELRHPSTDEVLQVDALFVRNTLNNET